MIEVINEFYFILISLTTLGDKSKKAIYLILV